ncbi:hypothetical protein EPO05_03865 [Patescibacteria group bacterium]|nr:MAG: hypothetical protein EPO05_03865 [Patescibacteria group bacterium]
MLKEPHLGADPKSADELEIQRLLETGEACDAEDARDAVNERQEVEFYRGVDREAALAEISETLRRLDKIERKVRGGQMEELPLSSAESHDRFELRFARATVTAGLTADEREYLHCNYLLPSNRVASDPAEFMRQENSRRRLEKRMDAIVVRLGAERARAIVVEWQKLLGQFFGDY